MPSILARVFQLLHKKNSGLSSYTIILPGIYQDSNISSSIFIGLLLLSFTTTTFGLFQAIQTASHLSFCRSISHAVNIIDL